MATCANDANGAALKAIQAVEAVAKGVAVHPRAGDLSYPDFLMQKCTQCKRCTEECPFGVLNEDEKGIPLLWATRCRRWRRTSPAWTPTVPPEGPRFCFVQLASELFGAAQNE